MRRRRPESGRAGGQAVTGQTVNGQSRIIRRGTVTTRGGTRGGSGRVGQRPLESSSQIVNRRPPGDSRTVGRAVPRGSVAPAPAYGNRYDTPRYGYGTYYNPRYGRRYGSRYYYRRPSVSIHHRYGYYPRYVYPRAYGSYFYMPGFSVGVGIGFPIGYRQVGVGFGYSGYGYPYGYGSWYGPGYGHVNYGHYASGPADAYTGFLRLKMRPRHAEVYVDGYYVGIVNDFDGIFQRIRIEEGSHVVEVRAPGYVPLELEVLIVPGEKVTYTGDLLPEP